MCSSVLNSRGKPAVSPMSGGPTFDIEKKNRNGANLKLRHALRAGGVPPRPTGRRSNYIVRAGDCHMISWLQFV